jgi:hypothetical protein
MSKRLYQQALEPFTLDERLRRLERQVEALTEQVARLTAGTGRAGEPVKPDKTAEAGADGAPASGIDYGRC